MGCSSWRNILKLIGLGLGPILLIDLVPFLYFTYFGRLSIAIPIASIIAGTALFFVLAAVVECQEHNLGSHRDLEGALTQLQSTTQSPIRNPLWRRYLTLGYLAAMIHVVGLVVSGIVLVATPKNDSRSDDDKDVTGFAVALVMWGAAIYMIVVAFFARMASKGSKAPGPDPG
jgi:ABC-type Fe3+ transport system permease subunit